MGLAEKKTGTVTLVRFSAKLCVFPPRPLHTAVEIARYLGCTQPPITIAVRQGEIISRTEVFVDVLKFLRP